MKQTDTEREVGGGGRKWGVFRKVMDSMPFRCAIKVVANSLKFHEIGRILLGIVEADKNGRIGFVVDGRVEQVDFLRIVCNIS